MDIDEIRNDHIIMHGLDKADLPYTFYHDETNNIRKLHVRAQGLNVAELKVFVLGGIVHEGLPRPLDVQSLRQDMKIQPSAQEFKLEHVAKGQFLDLLGSRKLTTFLNWISDNGLMIHYHDLDPLFWSIADIIDSILHGLGNDTLYYYHHFLKSDLVEILRVDLAATANLFYKYDFPGLAPQNRKPFLDELINVVELCADKLPDQNAAILKSVLKAGRGLNELAFIEGYTPNLLIKDFSVFYLARLAVFKHSQHILDMEDVIREQLEKDPLTNSGTPATHYRFADSKAEPALQVSDVVVGLLGKMHTYFTQVSETEVADARANLSDVQLTNANLLRDLISESHEANIAFLNHVSSTHDVGKLDLFLRFPDGKHVSSPCTA